MILLRTLNDLLRRLSKMGSTTIFCGRILTFLSGVFPLGERSGVNLRGEYGPTWEGVKGVEDKQGSESTPALEIEEKETGDADKMEVDEMKAEVAKKQSQDEDSATKAAGTLLFIRTAKCSLNAASDFYSTFWSLQLPFSKPLLFATPSAFNEFKDAVNQVLPVIREATTKERAMMGSRSTGNAGVLKRKREPEATEENGSSEYFFAKFLTSPDLLDLEVNSCKLLHILRLHQWYI